MISVLISILITVLIVGVILYCINLIPLPPPFHQIVQVIIGLIALLWIINLLFGLGGYGVGYGHPLLR